MLVKMQATLYRGSYSPVYFDLIRHWPKKNPILGFFPPSGIWDKNLSLLPFSTIKIVDHEGREEIIDNPQAREKWTETEPMLIFSSSGSSGNFKFVFLTPKNIDYVADTLSEHLALKDSDHMAILAPPFHVFGSIIGVKLCEKYGFGYSPMGRYTKEDCARVLSENPCTHILAVPTVFKDLLSVDLRAPRLRGGIVGGAPVSHNEFNRFSQGLNLPELTVGYGLTECSPVVTHTTVGEPLLPGYDIGKALPGTQIVLNEIGLASVSGPQVCYGIADAQGFHRSKSVVTGDILKLQSDRFFFMGREKLIIKKGGENISLQQVDAFLVEQFPHLEFVTVPVEDSRLGQDYHLLVIGGAVDHSEIQQSIAQYFGKYFCPKSIREIDQVMRLPSGKVSRNPQSYQLL